MICGTYIGGEGNENQKGQSSEDHDSQHQAILHTVVQVHVGERYRVDNCKWKKEREIGVRDQGGMPWSII